MESEKRKEEMALCIKISWKQISLGIKQNFMILTVNLDFTKRKMFHNYADFLEYCYPKKKKINK